ncbi:acyl-CoA desaturase [Telmatocola sphagniphila]|uniref:Acyl-CoA desaturase n=1 Tax=Telmatocola sphagniphila TaxID=1123043 RepID=A0A8E6BAK3_9BACT|nr:acyl-CoA desaturase [Telmatocola sphagniphila]QVL34176.1 acyl-CoA desaturase [Telmatocola sphagniphila]
MPELSEILVAERKSDFSSFEVPPQKVTLGVRLLTLVAIIVPLLGVMAAPFFVWGWGFGWTDLGLLLGMYTVSALGITIGFHRLFVHRSFETYVWIKFLWAIFGSMAIQGALFQWVGMHRRHHKFSDRPEDPHTPHHHGKGFLGLLKGFWHAHIGWFFNADPADFEHYIKDLKNIRSLRIANDLFPLWVALSLILPAVLGGIISSSWMGAWTGFIWGGLVRIFLVHHITWSVNSACHLWGMQPYHSDDESRNNIFFGILAMGEGWHNTHHAFPTSVRHGLSWWQIDTSYWVIRMMAFLGLAWNLKLPSKEAQRKERRITAKS